MRAPDFWWPSTPTFAARCLQPVGAVYGTITSRRMRLAGAVPARPVICVGNFTAGGAGKTPTAIALARRLTTLGHSVAFLTRGYGGRQRGPLLLGHDDPHGDTAAEYTHVDVGDEPLLLARHAPVMVARDRRAGLDALLAEGGVRPDAVIMDDGLQNPSIARTLNFAVVDAQTGIGNGLCIPAGPLRAPLAQQLPHVDALIVIGSGAAGRRVAAAAAALGKPVFGARLEADADAARLVRGRRVLAFAGIGRPDKFFATLEELDAEIVQRKAFPDHAPFTPAQIAALEDDALRNDLLPVTTEKDAVRLLTLTAAPRLRAAMAVLPVEIVFDDEDGLRACLAKALPPPSAPLLDTGT